MTSTLRFRLRLAGARTRTAARIVACFPWAIPGLMAGCAIASLGVHVSALGVTSIHHNALALGVGLLSAAVGLIVTSPLPVVAGRHFPVADPASGESLWRSRRMAKRRASAGLQTARARCDESRTVLLRGPATPRAAQPALSAATATAMVAAPVRPLAADEPDTSAPWRLRWGVIEPLPRGPEDDEV